MNKHPAEYNLPVGGLTSYAPGDHAGTVGPPWSPGLLVGVACVRRLFPKGFPNLSPHGSMNSKEPSTNKHTSQQPTGNTRHTDNTKHRNFLKKCACLLITNAIFYMPKNETGSRRGFVTGMWYYFFRTKMPIFTFSAIFDTKMSTFLN